MNQEIVRRLYELETTPEALEATRAYLLQHIRTIVQPNEKVLICFPDQGPASVGGLLGSVVDECGCDSFFWGPDFRWKSLLRLAFDSHASTIFGPPLVILGLMKIARTTATPLNIHNAVLGGYPYTSWLIEGVKRGLDCRIWGSYMIDGGPVIAGFTCAQEAGIHIREELFEATIRSRDGELMEDAQRGYLSMRYKKEPDLIFDTQETARIWHQPCSCGCDDARIRDTVFVGDDDLGKSLLEERFLAWSSILDYRVTRMGSDVELELVVFPGGTLPKIGSCTRVTVRSWNPDRDTPFCMEKYTKKDPE